MRALHSIVLSALLAIQPVACWAAQSDVPLVLKSVSVELPESARTFPPGPNADVVSNNCVACHSPGMILNQPALKRAAWDAEVHKMISVYKAPVAEADVPAIIDYLAKTKGAD